MVGQAASPSALTCTDMYTVTDSKSGKTSVNDEGFTGSVLPNNVYNDEPVSTTPEGQLQAHLIAS